MPFLCCHESELKNKGRWGNTGVGLAIHGAIRTCYLCFTNTPIFSVSLVSEVSEKASEQNKRSASGGSYISNTSYKLPKFRLNSLSLSPGLPAGCDPQFPH